MYQQITDSVWNAFILLIAAFGTVVVAVGVVSFIGYIIYAWYESRQEPDLGNVERLKK